MKLKSILNLRTAAAALLVSLTGASSGLAQGQQVDLLIKGGTVFDGSEGNKGYTGDVAISGDKIVYVGPHATLSARRTIDAKGMIVAPGFIDGHTHPGTSTGDRNFTTESDPQWRQVKPWIAQGASTIVVGVDGGGDPEIANMVNRARSPGLGVNIVPFVGYAPIRKRVIGEDARAPTPAELATEKQLVAKAMCEGAWGFSTGLWYTPQFFSKTDELIELAKEAAKRGGLYDTHQRDEATYSIGLLNSVKEAITIGREAGMPLHIAHIKALGPTVWGQSAGIIKLVNEARAQGMQVTTDQYPYPANQTSLQAQIIPSWALDGGYPALIKRFNDPATMEKIRVETEANLKRSNGAHAILFTKYGQPWTGKRLDEVAAEWKVTPFEAAVRILRQTDRQSIVIFSMSDQDINALMKQPWNSTGSDGGDGHPREYGTFPTKYQEYVVKKKVITLGQFIRSSTGLAADIYKLDKRGYLKNGYYADVVVFAPKKYVAKSDFVKWDQLAEGVPYLVVNGKLAIDSGKMTVALSGRPLLHTPTPGSCL